ncbi:(2Fe-2S)-binding protein [Streptomyces auratus]|uniref:(2Fe-2S)-binding protein n=1 Tax=Streptomyces auratus AGR0001 TaxID=1160718 RepID=J2A2N8_9ACTN|nr:(2Fe-2S)-binding protein [Streptomyces auratus]QTZ94833.1 (2Fe-2S)-binding protein [Streptomyces auratus AGR0001]
MTPVPAAPPAAHPVADAYARLSEVFPGLQVTTWDAAPPSGDGWVCAAGLAAGGAALETFLAQDDAQILRDHGQRARPDVVASFALHRYAWPACLLITLPWFLHGRVPRLPVQDVSFQREPGRMAVRIGAFCCLPDDPAAGLPGARVVPDEEALRAEVRAAVAEHLAPVLAGFAARMRRGPRALWGLASDELVEGLWYLGHLLGEEPRAVAALKRLLPGTTAPYVGTAGFRTLTGPAGESLPTRDRASCCMYYTLRPEDTCVTCPRTCDTARIKRLTATN